mgnify:CR=1 FL=1
MLSNKGYKALNKLKVLKNFSTSKKTTRVSLNLVIRDHDQSAYANSMNSTLDPRYFQIAHLWNQGNKVGKDQFFGHFEVGGQEPGKTAMSGRDPGLLYAKLHENAPDTWLRSLSRGTYGNSVFPLHPNDLRKWYNYVNKHGKKVIYKVFDYNTNLDEMEIALKIIKEMGAPIEIAIPHSPDPLYMEFFKKKVEVAARKAEEYGATLSVKRMVNGLTEDEAKQAAEIMIPIAMKHGIDDVTLHAHGDVSNSVAAFIKTAADYGIGIVRGDIVHHGSGLATNSPPTFPNYYDVANRLKQLGIDLDPSQQQLDILKEIDRIQQERDRRFVAVRTSGAFSVADKVAMGMPDGGEAYTVEAIIKAQIPAKLELPLQKTQDLFQEYYKEFRERFGMLVSVTPGHKRIEEGALTSMLNTIDWIKKLAAENKIQLKDMDPKFLRKELKKVSYDVLYHRLNPKTVDALRNNHLPVELTKEGFEFLCRAHMKNVLNQKEFDHVEPETKEQLIKNAPSVEKVSEIVSQLVSQNKIPKEAAIPRESEYHPLSLLQAAGKRLYTEGAGAKETGPNYRAMLEKYERDGSPISVVYGMNEAECLSILTGSPAYVDSSARRGPSPSPEGLTKEQFERELALYKKYIQAPPGTLIKERAHLLTAAEGLNALYNEQSEQYDFDELLEGNQSLSKIGSPKINQEIEEHDRAINLTRWFAQETEKIVQTH